MIVVTHPTRTRRLARRMDCGTILVLAHNIYAQVYVDSSSKNPPTPRCANEMQCSDANIELNLCDSKINYMDDRSWYHRKSLMTSRCWQSKEHFECVVYQPLSTGQGPLQDQSVSQDEQMQ